jgi:cyclopropane fatty-acyl-phospholipid synthase-like methyltransferase
MSRPSLDRKYFEDLYAEEPDPWQFESSTYERDKYEATLAALPRERYARALEVGCSIGVLTQRLGARCDSVLATDIAEEPLRAARRRCAKLSGVEFACSSAPGQWPQGRFDLILLSEVVYFLGRSDVATLAARVLDSLDEGGDLLLVHWTGPTDYPLSGDEAAELLLKLTCPPLRVVRHEQRERFRLDLASR